MAGNCRISGEELSAYAAGEVPEARAAVLEEHVKTCSRCGERLRRMAALDRALKRSIAEEMDERVMAGAWGAIGRSLAGASEVMTVPEAAAYLRVSREEMEQMLDELPVFELTGQLRIRRERLVEWMNERERSYRRELMRSRAVESLRIALVKGVAS